MDQDRQYLSVIIPVHRYFLPKSVNKTVGYESGIMEILASGSMTITEISRKMGYKGITKKLRTALDSLVSEGRIRKVISGG